MAVFLSRNGVFPVVVAAWKTGLWGRQKIGLANVHHHGEMMGGPPQRLSTGNRGYRLAMIHLA
jgi:hypothetical protein